MKMYEADKMSSTHGEKFFDMWSRKFSYVSKKGWIELGIILFVVLICVGIALFMAYGPEWIIKLDGG